MQILTPTGYKNIADCAVGDEVSAFDISTGAPIVNTIAALQWVDQTEWARWWQVEPVAPPFQFFRVNGTWTLNSEQSIWRNGANVCHAKHLIVGDIVYDDADREVTITSVEEVSADGWYRFDISGDHSYIVDGLTLHNASRFWVGGTGTWDAATTTHWAATSGGAGGQSVPGASDTVTLDASSGGGTVTVNFGGTVTIQSFAMGNFTGTFDNSVNNNNFTVSATAGFTSTGSGTRTTKLGTATYTISANNGNFGVSATNHTFTGNTGCSVVFTGASGSRTFAGAGLSHGSVTLGASSGGGFCNITGSNTLAAMNITAPNVVALANLTTNTVSSAFTWTGSPSAQILIISNILGATATIAATAGSAGQYCALRDAVFTGSPVFTNSFDLLNNSGSTITGPGGGGGWAVIGG